MKMDECMVEIKNQEAQHLKVTFFEDIDAQPKEAQHYHSQIWIANDDNDVEGEWVNWYTGEVGRIHKHVTTMSPRHHRNRT